MTPVIDIFAGPGGLSEGFTAFKNKNRGPVFDIKLSIEMDASAYETLKLRTFYRSFGSDVPEDYYRHLRREIGREALYEAHPFAARQTENKCWHAALGPGGEPTAMVRDRIRKVIGSAEDWVLIGGPPCQAYSIAGRSRNHGNPLYDPEQDVRQRLYVEYLQILADHRPAVFIMENVKGLLSATLNNNRIFHRILDDLRSPGAAVKREGRTSCRGRGCKYRIFSLVEPTEFENGNIQGSVIQAEYYGIPQARHRIILLGIRDDLSAINPNIMKPQPMVPLSAVIESLPPLRSGLSRIPDSADSWKNCLRSQVNSRWANAGARKADSPKLSRILRKVLRSITPPELGRGGEFVRFEPSSEYRREWYCDSRIQGVCNHVTRAHMEKDLYRYMYAACFAKLNKNSPKLKHFPTDLLPDHFSVGSALKYGEFEDRFRVQISDNPSTTIMSHICKDGHYYIHPDPEQCRSLTVREAARLQTFPDNYYFCGPRTAQYIQVGNAVPPLLAYQIAEIVHDILVQGGANS